MRFRRARRIAFICFSESNGGLELTTVGLAAKVCRRSAEAMLIVPPDTPMADAAKRENLCVVHLRPRLKYGDVVASIQLAKILRAHEVDVAVIMQSGDLNVAAIAKQVYPRVKLVFYQQMQSGLDKRDLLHTWIYSKLSLWISLTNRMRQEVLEHTRVPGEKIRAVPLGVDTGLYAPDRYDRIRARRYFNLPSDRPIVGTLTRLDPKKGLEDLLSAIPLVLERHETVLFAVAGEETNGKAGYKDCLIRVCKELAIETHVKFLPFTSNVSRYLAALDLFVLPSHSETFGLALIEAMAMQRAVIATHAGGVPEIVEDGKSGLLVPPRDSVALAGAVNRLLDDPACRLVLGKCARKRVLDAFDAKKCTDRLVSSIDSLFQASDERLAETVLRLRGCERTNLRLQAQD